MKKDDRNVQEGSMQSTKRDTAANAQKEAVSRKGGYEGEGDEKASFYASSRVYKLCFHFRFWKYETLSCFSPRGCEAVVLSVIMIICHNALLTASCHVTMG